ncbi:hypothetical protein MCUN1_003145 [Malassezia cuniculi]|uniref:Kinesin-like protein n=1 Tax=Malassezia cuniculi TaxID=948313 RepID=A0AAF0J756_9BASI|nr:hypothetical protein MCUN1_003145 [Malassezia cuniculi]
MAANVRVVARFRPASIPDGTLNDGDGDVVVDIDGSQNVRVLRGAASAPFVFDRVFPMDSTQADVFEYAAKETVGDILQGYNGTIFAYGQTGSGKTYTMMGPDIDDEQRGIIPRISRQIFEGILASPPTLEYLVKVSYMEIYMERVRDLLAPAQDNLQIHEDRSNGVHVKGLSEYYVSDASEVLELIQRGSMARAVSSTRMNTESSRSHSIFVFNIQQKSSQTGTIKNGRLYLVDLAGSEKVGKTGASGQTLEEAKKINKSLSALGMVINALTDGKSQHVPYRDSKLTRILQESLGGNSRTTLIVNCSPCAYNIEETLSTLRFGVRAKSIKNNAHINAELSPEELRHQLRRAREKAAALGQKAAVLSTELSKWRAGEQVPPSEWAELEGESGSQEPKDASESDEDESQKAIDSAAANALRAELEYVRAQEATLVQRNRQLAAELSEARVRIEELASEHQEANAELNVLRSSSSRADSPREEISRSREERLAESMSPLEARAQADLGSVLATFSKLEAGAIAAGTTPADVHTLRQTYVQTTIALGEQTQRAKKYEQENEVLREQKQAISNRMTALQKRFDLISDRLSALEYSTRPGDDSSEQISALRTLLEEQSASFRDDESSEVSQLQKLLSIRGEEAAALTRSLDELRASHEEQKNALRLLSQAPEGGNRIDTDLVQRLVQASSQMEQSREVVALRLQEYDAMKRDLMNELRTRSERLVEMEMSLENMQEQYRALAQAMSLRSQQKKMAILEKHLEQLTTVQKELVDQNAALKKDMAVYEKRIEARDDRIAELEERLSSAANTRATTPVPDILTAPAPAAVYSAPQLPTAPSAPSAPSTGPSFALPYSASNASRVSLAAPPAPTFGRIAKPIRGGGGTSASAADENPRPKGSWFFAAK